MSASNATASILETEERGVDEKILSARLQSLPSTLQLEVGPPDLYVTVRTAPSTGWMSSINLGGLFSKGTAANTYFHHILGLAATPERLREYHQTLVRLYQDKGSKIDKGTYCCYNIFTGEDVRLTWKEGAPSQNALEVRTYRNSSQGPSWMTGTESELNWSQLFLSSIIRTMYLEPFSLEGFLDEIYPSLANYTAFRSLDEEKLFLEEFRRAFLDPAALDPSSGSAFIHFAPDVVYFKLLEPLFQYFRVGSRLGKAVEFFSGLDQAAFARYPLLAVRLGQAYAELGSVDQAVTFLSTIAERFHPNFPALYVALARCFILRDDVANALRCAAAAESADPRDPLPKMASARALIKGKRYEDAIKKLYEITQADGEKYLWEVPFWSLNPSPSVSQATPPIAQRAAPASASSSFLVDMTSLTDLNLLQAELFDTLVDITVDISWAGFYGLYTQVSELQRVHRSRATPPVSPAMQHTPHIAEHSSNGHHAMAMDIDTPSSAPVSPLASSGSSGGDQPLLPFVFIALQKDVRRYSQWLEARASIDPTAVRRTPIPYNSSDLEAIGRICERLKRWDDAGLAYAYSVSKQWTENTWLLLLDLFSRTNKIRETMVAASRQLEYCDYLRTSPSKYAHWRLTRSINRLIAKCGYHNVTLVRMSFVNNSEQPVHPTVSNVILEAPKWQVDGFNASAAASPNGAMHA